MTTLSATEIRQALKRELPGEVFEPQPQRGVAALVTFVFMLGAAAAIVALDLPWWGDMLLSLAIGEGIVSNGLVAHESEHGSVFESRLARKILAWVGFGPLLVTPELWLAWHIRAHHRGTNQINWDPDMLADVSEYHDDWSIRLRTRLFAGSRHWLSWIGYFILFTGQGQFFLWISTAAPPLSESVRMDHRALKISSSLLIGSWLGLAIWLGPLNALWILILPLLFANFILMGYISTQHWIRPRLDADDPFIGTVSVSVPKWADVLHYQFSYHQEHHIFPSMSGRFAPLLREKLREIAPDAVAVMPILEATRQAFSTPALYADDTTLAYLDGSEVDLVELGQRLELPSLEGAQAQRLA